MKSLWIKERFKYDGTQLRSLYGYLEHKVQGDSVVAWRGPCSISFEHMVDGEDVLAQSPIAGDDMLHFIIEKFHLPLMGGVLLQRYFAAQTMEVLREKVSALAPRPHDGLVPSTRAMELRREGDDIYWFDAKLSISIATVSPVSTLIHFAMNVVNEGAPVRTAALCDFLLDPKSSLRSSPGSSTGSLEDELSHSVEIFAEELMNRFVDEVNSADIATVKVRWVR